MGPGIPDPHQWAQTTSSTCCPLPRACSQPAGGAGQLPRAPEEAGPRPGPHLGPPPPAGTSLPACPPITASDPAAPPSPANALLPAALTLLPTKYPLLWCLSLPTPPSEVPLPPLSLSLFVSYISGLSVLGWGSRGN